MSGIFPVRPHDPWQWLLSNAVLYWLYAIHPDRVVWFLFVVNAALTCSFPMLTCVLYVLELLKDQP